MTLLLKTVTPTTSAWRSRLHSQISSSRTILMIKSLMDQNLLYRQENRSNSNRVHMDSRRPATLAHLIRCKQLKILSVLLTHFQTMKMFWPIETNICASCHTSKRISKQDTEGVTTHYLRIIVSVSQWIMITSVSKCKRNLLMTCALSYRRSP